jgi:competence protein ComGC
VFYAKKDCFAAVGLFFALLDRSVARMELVLSQSIGELAHAVKSKYEGPMKSLAGILVVLVVSLLVYKYYFGKAESDGTATPAQTINIVGVKNDLIAIAQAERAYQAEHGSYASLDDLTSGGAVTFEKRGRQGYTYEIQNPAGGFRVVAHCPAATNPGCNDYFIDQSMEVQTGQ